MTKEHIKKTIESRGDYFEVDVGIEKLVKSINEFQFGKDNYPFDTTNSCQERPTNKDAWIELRTHYPQLLDIILKEVHAHTHCNINHKCSKFNTESKTECDIYIDCYTNKMNILALDKIAREIKRYSC